MAERMELKKRFDEMDDDELLRRYRSGDMTEFASGVAAELLRERNLPIDQQPPTEAEPALAEPPEPGDVVCLTRMASPMQAEILCGLLESEGVYATAADANLIRTDSFLTAALGGIRIMVGEADLQRARRIEQAYRRGDFAIPSDD